MGAIFLPAIIVAAVGLVFGIILTVAAKVMFVPVDERVSAIKEVLPGANCGACGFAGCDGYADAIVAENLSPSLCPVGGPDVAAQIAGIMGVEAGEMEPMTAMVMCNGNCNATKEVLVPDRLHTCKEAKMFYGGQWACTHGCLGLGDCLAECAYDAICISNGVATINKDLCVGCGACAKVCPNHIIDVVKKKDTVFVRCNSTDKGAVARRACSVACIGCMKCTKVCKFDAIVVENNLARIDRDKCKNCGLCAKECPTGAIVKLPKWKPQA